METPVLAALLTGSSKIMSRFSVELESSNKSTTTQNGGVPLSTLDIQGLGRYL